MSRTDHKFYLKRTGVAGVNKSINTTRKHNLITSLKWEKYPKLKSNSRKKEHISFLGNLIQNIQY